MNGERSFSSYHNLNLGIITGHVYRGEKNRICSDPLANKNMHLQRLVIQLTLGRSELTSPSLTYILPLLTITLNLALLQLLFALLHLLCAYVSFVPNPIASFKYSSMSDFNNYGGSEEEYASVRKFVAETVRQPPLPIAHCHQTI